jgi:hypothetical protein
MAEMLVVMLIWAGGERGGAATIPDFSSVMACEAARPRVEATYQSGTSRALGFTPRVWTACIEVPR